SHSLNHPSRSIKPMKSPALAGPLLELCRQAIIKPTTTNDRCGKWFRSLSRQPLGLGQEVWSAIYVGDFIHDPLVGRSCRSSEGSRCSSPSSCLFASRFCPFPSS